MMQAMTHGAMHGMSQGMMSDAGGWLMMSTHAVGFIVIVLAGAALVKYLFFSPRSAS